MPLDASIQTASTADPRPASTRRQGEGFNIAGRRCFLIGAGGCGMSGLARMLRQRGAHVSGSDTASTPVTDALVSEGVPVSFDQSGQSEGAIPNDCDLVITSAAIPDDHPQRQDAHRRHLDILTYAEALGACMLGRTGVAVAGTHGKSTIVAMLGHALSSAGLDPSVIVGATCRQLAKDPTSQPTGFRLGASAIPAGALAGSPGLLLAEACEFNRSFHHLRPVVASINIVEADHLDVYGSLDAVIEAFTHFARLLPAAESGGKLLIGHDAAHRNIIASGVTAAVETVGFAPGADWSVTCDTSSRRVELTRQRERIASWTLQLPGEHNALNSAFAAALAISLGAEPDAVSDALTGFLGVDRRMQHLGERQGVRVYDDYGHHPTEIDATLRALRQYERPHEQGGRLICVFQPHQHSRTRFLLEQFAQSFSQADVVIVPDIYFVRDSQIEKTRVSAADLVDRLRLQSVQAMHLYPFDAIVEQLRIICKPGDLLVVMGAGPVWQVARDFLSQQPDAASNNSD